MGKLELNKKKKKDALSTLPLNFYDEGTYQNYNFRYCRSGRGCQGDFLPLFKDKYDIRNKLVSHKTGELFSGPMRLCRMHISANLTGRYILL